MTIFVKDPAAVLDYAVDWQAAYLAGQTITVSEWNVTPEEPDGISVTVAVAAGGRSVATLTGGRRGHIYRVTNRVTFADGRRDERNLNVRVEDR